MRLGFDDLAQTQLARRSGGHGTNGSRHEPSRRRRRPGGLQPLPQFGQGWPRSTRSDDRVNVASLRDMTDDSGGRTEIIRGPRDLDPATAGIADELSKQYYLGYQSTGKKDGRWHSIRVEAHNRNYRVRARKGYIALETWVNAMRASSTMTCAGA